jgi:uncharacterized protein (DUF849 family)
MRSDRSAEDKARRDARIARVNADLVARMDGIVAEMERKAARTHKAREAERIGKVRK